MTIKLIMFDLDGTLVNTAQDITNALNIAIKPYGMKNLTVEDTIQLIGEGISRLVEKILSVENMHLRSEIMNRFLEYYSEHIIEHSKEYPHVKETLENLTTIKKAVISNKREDLSKRLLEELGLSEYFDLIIGSDTTGERKPSPVPVLYVINKLGLSGDESIIVGDSNYDIEAGKKAKVKTVAVTYGYRPRESLREADYIIDDIRELIPLLNEI
ncbi:MAG TPA: HAD-IA family hydrolase [Thermodesulfovibrionales bacterium]|nr:HAD-IA family hydrolase [Thermodesulfovibrionales bacterium]